MTKKLHVGVAGCRWVGRCHAEGFSRRKDVELTALADQDADIRNDVGNTLGFKQTFEDYKQMIRGADLDAVVVALPTFMHFEACMTALRAGCHVLCEKPPTSTLAEMTGIAGEAEKRGLVYMFGRQPRFSPNVQAARRLVARSVLGDVYHAEASWVRARWRGLAGRSWRLDRKLGGGVLLDLGVHAIDEAWFCMGCPKPVEISAGMHTAFRRFAGHRASYTADDAAAGFVRFANGATLSFEVTFALNTPGPDGLDQYTNKTPEWGSTRLYGTKAGLDVKRGLLTTGGLDGVSVRPITAKGSTPVFEAQAREFVRAIQTGRPPLNSADQAVLLMRMLDAARRSGDTGRSVGIATKSRKKD